LRTVFVYMYKDKLGEYKGTFANRNVLSAIITNLVKTCLDL